MFCDCSPEGKAILEDKLSEVAAYLLAAYDSGEFISALEEGSAGWQKWVKSFGKALKRKVCSIKKGSITYTTIIVTSEIYIYIYISDIAGKISVHAT